MPVPTWAVMPSNLMSSFGWPKRQTLIVFHGGDGGSSIGEGSNTRPGLLHEHCGVEVLWV